LSDFYLQDVHRHCCVILRSVRSRLCPPELSDLTELV